MIVWFRTWRKRRAVYRNLRAQLKRLNFSARESFIATIYCDIPRECNNCGTTLWDVFDETKLYDQDFGYVATGCRNCDCRCIKLSDVGGRNSGQSLDASLQELLDAEEYRRDPYSVGIRRIEDLKNEKRELEEHLAKVTIELRRTEEDLVRLELEAGEPSRKQPCLARHH